MKNTMKGMWIFVFVLFLFQTACGENQLYEQEHRTLIEQLKDSDLEENALVRLNDEDLDRILQGEENTVFTWEYIYLTCAIHEDDFICRDGVTNTVEFMSSVEDYLVKTENAKGLMKPYVDETYQFVILMPNDGVTVLELVSSLSNETIDTMIENKERAIIYANIPKFEISSFSTKNNQKQEVFFRVAERGILEGAKETADDECPCGIPLLQPIRMYFDHPFLFLVIQTETRKPIYMGYVLELP